MGGEGVGKGRKWKGLVGGWWWAGVQPSRPRHLVDFFGITAAVIQLLIPGILIFETAVIFLARTGFQQCAAMPYMQLFQRLVLRMLRIYGTCRLTEQR